VFVEVHKDLYGMKPGMYRETVKLLEQRGLMGLVDEAKLREAVLGQSGMPVDVSHGGGQRVPAPIEAQRPNDVQRAAGSPEAAPAAAPADDLETDDLRAAPSSEARAPSRVVRPAPVQRRPGGGTEILLPAEVIVPTGRRPVVAED
jgi:hypothetical protein